MVTFETFSGIGWSKWVLNSKLWVTLGFEKNFRPSNGHFRGYFTLVRHLWAWNANVRITWCHGEAFWKLTADFYAFPAFKNVCVFNGLLWLWKKLPGLDSILLMVFYPSQIFPFVAMDTSRGHIQLWENFRILTGKFCRYSTIYGPGTVTSLQVCFHGVGIHLRMQLPRSNKNNNSK